VALIIATSSPDFALRIFVVGIPRSLTLSINARETKQRTYASTETPANYAICAAAL
jgi:hypothetical protein